MSLLPYKDIGTLTTKKKMGVMVRKGFITPQNKQHENSIVLRSLVFILIFFSSQKLKAQN
jgi:hypothetical protein